MKIKNKIITISVVIVSLVALFGIGYYVGWNAAQKDAIPDKPDVEIKPVPGQTCTITIEDLKFYDLALQFTMKSTGPGAGEASVRRPEKWLPTPPPKNIIIAGLGGGYSCGKWLPGGSAAYLRRIGGFRGVNFYLGPGLSVSALDGDPVGEYIDVGIYLQAAATW
jgi:hypothetical protein